MKHGFSLVELSIVLVILGLLTGGILGGQSLMRAAELRSVGSDVNEFKTAMHSFRDRYLAWPGDMRNAVSFWGAAAGGTAEGPDATCIALDYTSPSTDSSTCNGNGDGFIAIAETATPTDSRSTLFEAFRVWQHLANAGMLTGSYTGVSGSGGALHHIPAENIPTSKFNSGGYSLLDTSLNFSGFILNAAENGTTLLLGQAKPPVEATRAIFRAEDVWQLDMKYDDGKPGTGQFKVFRHNDCTNSTGNDDTSASYTLSDDTTTCNLAVIRFLE